MMNQATSLTPTAREYQLYCEKLVNQILVGIYYEYDVKGFINTRTLGETEFEYAPLSKVSIETQSGLFYTFIDSSKFLKNFGYYTLDLIEENEIESSLKKSHNQSEYFLWKNFVNQKVRKLEIVWGSLYNNYHKDNPSDIYPKCMILQFDNNRELAIAASEIDLEQTNKYKFRYPDEAIVIFFSKETFYKYLPNKEKK